MARRRNERLVKRHRQRRTSYLSRSVYRIAEGHFVVPMDPNGPIYNVRELHRYCKARGIDPSKLSDEELRQFEVKKTNMFSI